MKKLLLLLALIAGLYCLSSCGGKKEKQDIAGLYCYEMPETKGEVYLFLNEDGTCLRYAEWVDSLESVHVESVSAVGKWERGLSDNLIHIELMQKSHRLEELALLQPSADNDTLTDPTGRWTYVRFNGTLSPINQTDTIIITPIVLESEEDYITQENGYQHNVN